MKKNQSLIGLITATVVVVTINISNLIGYICESDSGGLLSNCFFAASLICIIIGWIMYFVKRRQE